MYHCYTGVLALLVQLHHCWRNVTSCDDVLLVSDRRLDDKIMKIVRNQGDEEAVHYNRSIECLFVRNIERDWGRKLDAFCLPLGAFKSSASWRKLAMVVPELLDLYLTNSNFHAPFYKNI